MKTSSVAGNYPTPRSSGPLEWIKDKIAAVRNRRTTRGGYEESRDTEGQYAGGNDGAGRRGRGLEDDAWDTRVGNEDPYGPGPGGYYEEQELGLAATPGVYNQQHAGGSDYMGQSTTYEGANHERGRSGGLDPFGDQHEAPSLRSVSPRPETAQGHIRGQDSLGSQDGNSSPTSTRKSVFREGI